MSGTDVVISVRPGNVETLREQFGVEWFWNTWNRVRAKDWGDLISHLRDNDQNAAADLRRKFLTYALGVAGSLCAPFCRFSDVGSKSPSSDIDVTVLSTRSLTAVRIVNDLFSRVFLDAPNSVVLDMGTVLDINVYSNAYYAVCGGAVVPVEACPGGGFVLDEAAKLDQVRWSIYRIPLDKPDWWSADAGPLLKAGVELLHEAMRSCAEGDDGGSEAAAVGKAEATLGLLADKVREDDAKGAADLRRRYVNAVSTVRALETGAYLSYGAFAHVVLSTQAGTPVLLTDLDYIASFFDNLGFFIESESEDGQPSMKSVKYFDRCMQAAKAADGSLSVVGATRATWQRGRGASGNHPSLVVSGLGVSRAVGGTSLEELARRAITAKKNSERLAPDVLPQLRFDAMSKVLIPIAHRFQGRIVARMGGNTPLDTARCADKNSNEVAQVQVEVEVDGVSRVRSSTAAAGGGGFLSRWTKNHVDPAPPASSATDASATRTRIKRSDSRDRRSDGCAAPSTGSYRGARRRGPN